MQNEPIILPYRGEFNLASVSPIIAANSYVAPGAAVIGDVVIGEQCGIWFSCVVRGDVNTIRIGDGTNIQDGTVIHVTRHSGPTLIGKNVTVGHSALMHACTVEDNAFIGMRSTLMDGAVVEQGGWLAAGALLTPNKRVPSGELWAGSPAKFFRKLSADEMAFISESAQNYKDLADEYLALKP